MKKLKITTGDWFRSKNVILSKQDNSINKIAIVCTQADILKNTQPNFEDPEMDDNTELFLEAGQVYNECYLSPKELLRQKEILYNALCRINVMCADSSNNPNSYPPTINIGELAKITIDAIKKMNR